ncbi:hypothetical protein [Actinorugispora endophytica]|uniref:Uncharacterized protein n=1 Tax=Actinorugispora endophytica TaxID=1605990 RepID=A0A4R6V5T1_9ACTN|nr:hypothetical protein [Actinorugispora endophytica]TDQ54195.1 hypothetical protein EV190_10227 [Actinorugispora endophytica]
MPHEPPNLDDEFLRSSLASLLRKGLPVATGKADPSLLSLRAVLVRAVDPADTASRVAALNAVLRTLLLRFDDARYAEAVRALFGLSPGKAGTTLTQRREAAAKACGHDVDHFRKRVEPRLVERLAWMLWQDSEQFRAVPAAAPRLTLAPKNMPTLPADVFAWELAEHETQLSRVWASLYALRAELLTLDRMAAMGADRQEVIRQAVTSAWRYGVLRADVDDYLDAYPSGGFGALADASPDDLVALAGWTPSLGTDAVDKLTHAGRTHRDRDGFVIAMRAEVALGNAWAAPWLDRRITTDKDTTA